MATAAASAASAFGLRSDTPSACSSLIVVASVNGRRPERAFSSVEMLILAISARYWREMRRRASSSRTMAATDRLCSSESWFSENCVSELARIIRLIGKLRPPNPPPRS